MKGYEDFVKLLQKVQSTGGMDTDQKTVCEYQDMIGHSSAEQLEELANGKYKEAFYRVYGISYGTIEAIRFHCEHGAKIREILDRSADLECDLATMTDKYENMIKQRDEIQRGKAAVINELNNTRFELTSEKEKNEALQSEITALKAKLYDLMTR